MNIPSFMEKDETGESIVCSRCQQIILLQPNKYPEKTVQEKIRIHYHNCKENINQTNIHGETYTK